MTVFAALFLAATAQAAPFDPARIDLAPETCRPDPALVRLLAFTGGRGADDPAVAAAVSGRTTHRIDFAAPVAWHGLRLVAVSAVQGIESGPTRTTLHFAEDVASAAPHLARYRLPATGTRPIERADGLDGSVSLAPDGRGSALTCEFD
jgi:hypothetical protein